MRPFTLRRFLPLLSVLLVAPATVVDAARFRVNSQLDAVDAAPGDGVCATATGVCTLRAAIQESNARPGGDVIRLPAGHYVLTRHGADEDAAVTGDLDVTGRLRLIGAGSASTIIDGDDADRVLDVSATAPVTLVKLTVRNGLRPTGASLPFGGGIHAAEGTRLRLRLVVVEQNAAVVGGGVASMGRIILRRSAVRDNVALESGGGLVVNGVVLSYASTFSGNVASGTSPIKGHDVALQGGPATFVNSTITGELATVSTCPLADLCIDAADVLLANVTANVVTHLKLGTDSGSVTLRNSIVEVCDADLISQGYNFIAQEGCVVLGNLNGVVVGDTPLLSSLGDRGGPTQTRVPSAVSEAVDNGHPAPPGSGGFACELYDQRGVERPRGLGCDMGAVEAH